MEYVSNLINSVFGVSLKNQRGGSGFDGFLEALEGSLPSKNVRTKRPRKAKTRTRKRKKEEQKREEQKKQERVAAEKEKKAKRLERERKKKSFAPLWQKYASLIGKSPPKNKYRYDEEWLNRKIKHAENDQELAEALKMQHISRNPNRFNL